MNEKEKNIEWFENEGKRKLLIIQFYSELESIGVVDDIGLKSYCRVDDFKFKFDGTDAIIPDEKLLKKVYKLTSKYEKLINSTCKNCGNKINYGGSDYFCEKCFFEILKSRNYETINDLGFSYSTNSIISSDSRVFIRWNMFTKANFINDKNSIVSSGFPTEIDLKYKTPVFIGNIEDYFSFEEALSVSFENENFYTLLKHIPNKLLSDDDKKIKDDLINHLDNCNICGYKAIYNKNRCLVCYNIGFGRELSERMKKTYSTIDEWYKKMQLEYRFENTKFKYPRRENEFEKSENHIKLFTDKELDDLKYERAKIYNR